MGGEMVRASSRTLAADLTTAARFGGTGRGGISRLAWTDELAAVTAWVADELVRLGLDAAVDAAGNLIARWPAPAGKAIMAGSHLDTVPDAGAFDGALGVLGAVEAIRMLRRSGFVPARPIWVGAFMDEEGARFGTALFGSRAFAGHDMSEALSAVDDDGIAVHEAMARRGFDPARIREAQRIDEVGSYLELHIEQGPVLGAQGRRLGLVESICGVLGIGVTVDGEANHAGTTPSDRRRDALVGAARMVLALRDHAAQQPDVRATVGKIATVPGATTVIPGRCIFSVDLRAARFELLEPVQRWFEEMVAGIAAEEDLSFSIEHHYVLPPVLMDRAVSHAIRAAAREHDVEPLPMWSGAGHDAMVIAGRVPTGMLFVPSRDGLSHSALEWTSISDCELGARVLAGAIRRLAS